MIASPTNATQAKERLYAQLAGSLGRMSRTIKRTSDLCEEVQADLHAMRVLAGLDAAKFMTVGALIIPPDEGDGEKNKQTEEVDKTVTSENSQ